MILASGCGPQPPVITGVADAISQPKTDIRLFGKPSTRKYRRMGVVLTYGAVGDDVNALRERARAAAAHVAVDGVPTTYLLSRLHI